MSDEDTDGRGTVYDSRPGRIVRVIREFRFIAVEAFLLVCVFAGIVGLGLLIARAMS